MWGRAPLRFPFNREAAVRILVSQQPPAATPLRPTLAPAHAKSMMSPSCFQPMAKCAEGIRAGLLLPSTDSSQSLLWVFSLAWLRYLRVVLHTVLGFSYPILLHSFFPFIVSHLPHGLKLSPACFFSLSLLSFIGISLNKSLACLILSWHLLLRGSELTEDVNIQGNFMAPNCRK